ncbi:MAG: RluA family pseudouridine synthase [Pseudomonadota bacterium]
MEQEQNRTFSFSITEEESDRRIDIFLASRITDLTRSRVQDLIRSGFVKVNDDTPKRSYRVKSGDFVSVSIPPPLPYHLQPEPVPLDPVYEDASLIVVNKPPGMVMHPAPGHATGTLVHGLLHHCRGLSGIGGILRPGIVHRLDKDTSGLVVVAKNDRAHHLLADQFKAGGVNKRYVTIVHGLIRGEKGKIELPIARHPKKRKEMSVRRDGGRWALTFWKKIEELGREFTLLHVSPKTGRTHQIRVHLSYVGHPVVGDSVYGHKRNWWKKRYPQENGLQVRIARQMLHAETLGFVHPESERYCEFHAPLPGDMEEVLMMLKSINP